jgi:Fe-S cluster biogenesis protein NfuA
MPNSMLELLPSRVERTLRSEVFPALGLDGRAVEVVGIENGVVSVRLGACGGCPASLLSVVTQIEQELRRHVPEVEILEVVP